ncbi:MAG: cupin domain-containing protein [Alphaproteobacteria bacterium]|nr:XRE family transcriptional regulator [Alphaproteobacteria bacterium]MDE2110396.1 cupin domain-containing protein [Alphaproteobacteria bacterium]MDE2493445.1 cupin domain-containing protein [Alphaproteobacteria bacterium]
MRKYIGERIKALREAQDMTLAQVCKLTGIEAERLRAYEEGAAVPSIGAVIQLSRVLGSKMEGLLHGGGAVSEHLTICRSADSLGGDQSDTEQSYAYRSLTRPGTAGHVMEPFLLSFDPKVAQGVPITHDGQEFVYIVDGVVELFYDGRSYRLEQGDSAYLDSSLPHTFHGLGDNIARMLAVVSS